MSNAIETAYFALVDMELLMDQTQTAVASVRDRVTILRRSFKDHATEIDRVYSAALKPQMHGENRNTFRQRLNAEVTPHVEKIAADIEALEKRRQPSTSVNNEVVRELRAIETRASFAKVDPVDRRPLVLEHAQRGDVAFVEAIENPPMGMLVDAVVLREARAALKATLYPQITRQLAETERVYRVVLGMIADFERELDIDVDPIREAAEGKTSAAVLSPTLSENAIATDAAVRRAAQIQTDDDPE